MMLKAWAIAVAILPLIVFGQTVSTPNKPTPLNPPQPAGGTAPDYHLPALPTLPAESAPASGGDLFVRRIEVRGVRVFKPETISAIIRPYENRTLSNGELQSLRVALTQLYTDKGYVNSGVLLPDQKVNDGVVVYQAVEGVLSRVEVTGSTKLRPGYVAKRVRAHVAEPLNLAQLQVALRYLQEDPNVARLDARLAPGDGPGQSTLHVKVDEQPRFMAGISGDNHHSSSIGEWEGTLTLGARDLTGYGDEWRGSVVRAAGDTEGSGSFSIPFTARNASFQAYFSYAKSGIIQQPFKSLNIDERTRTYGLQLSVPLADTLNNRFSLFAGAESDHSYTTLLGEPFSFSPGAQYGVSNVALALGGFDWLLRGASNVTDLRVTYRRGIDALGATTAQQNANTFYNPNPTGANALFGLEQWQFIFVQRLSGFGAFSRLNDRAQLMIRSTGQLSQDPLLLLEKFTIGGVDTVRGLPENLLVRDNGATASMELQLPIPGYRAEPDPRNLVVAAFVDYGRSWDKVNSATGSPNLDTTNPLYVATAGLGLLWNPLNGLTGHVYWGRKIADNFTAANDPIAFAPNDLQKRGVHVALNYVVNW